MLNLKETLKNAVLHASQNKCTVSLSVNVPNTHSWSMYYNTETKTYSYSYRTSDGSLHGMFSDNDWCTTFESCFDELTGMIEVLTDTNDSE